MGGGSSPPKNTETTQKTEPWSGQQPYLTDVFSQAKQQYYGPGPECYPGSTVAPMSSDTQLGLELEKQRALAGNPGVQAAQTQAVDTLGGNYLNANPGNLAYLAAASQTNPALGYIQPYAANQVYQPGVGYMGSVVNDNSLTPDQQYLTSTASGEMLGSNPFLDAQFQRMADQITHKYQTAISPGIDAAFASAGGAGSSAHQNAVMQGRRALGESLSGAASNLYGQEYENERQTQLQAAGQIEAARQGNIAQRLGAAGALNQAALQGAGTQLSAAQLLGGLSSEDLNRLLGVGEGLSENYSDERTKQMVAAGMSPELAKQDHLDIAALGDVGAQKEAYNQAHLNDQIARWNFEQQLPANKLAQYMPMIQGNYGGTGTTTQPYYGSGGGSGMGSLIGTGVGAAALGLGAALAPETFGLSIPVAMMLGGAAGGGIGGMFG